jgi:MFS family permease
LICSFIFVDIVCTNYILKSFSHQEHTKQFFSFLCLLFLQIIASPIQAAFSDLYCRKKSLVFSLLISLLSLILVAIYTHTGKWLFFLICLTITLKGLLGNTIPLLFAAIADVRNKKIRLSFGIATTPYTVGYFWIIFTNKTLSEPLSILFAIALVIATIILCSLFFKDIRDKDRHQILTPHSRFSILKAISMEITLVINKLRNRTNQMAFLSYLLWEISLYSILLGYVDFGVKTFSNIGIAMLCGALTAVFFIRFKETADDNKLIKWGYTLSSFSLLPFFLVYPFFNGFNYYLLCACYFLHTMGNIILSASLFSVMAKRTPSHECGKMYGLLDAVDVIAFLISAIIIMAHQNFGFNLIYLISFSYLTVAVSWFPYAQFKKAEKI